MFNSLQAAYPVVANSINDAALFASTGNVMHLAAGNEVTIDTNQSFGAGAPSINIIFSDDIKKLLLTVGAILVIFAVGCLLFKNAFPAKGGGEGGGGVSSIFRKMGGPVPFTITICCAIAIMVPEMSIKLINLVVKIGYGILSMIVSAF